MQPPFEPDSKAQSATAPVTSEVKIRRPTVPNRASPTHSERYFSKCVIRVLERNGRTSATVAWSDSTSCCYGEQHWRRCIARKAGICALSGQSIAKGDAVFRPKPVQPLPRNFEAMILATVMEAIALEEGV
ncbi:DUF3331 domain-containing protein [Paraburkholderia kirstenboschensis]|uniref:DUF3331 domain-containing protein n=1 Tax=Paraburkholderia kirstenboschensis TaxID=1245436 RepID=A0ABZ0EB13_9BURK|nr:DUF3331 domain-containing protein [Paraburkholderia kirstenboschensis]WOD13659.1 DUF3331 domain-containing protein [Paraburkholderia kirstenboschensis]